MSFINEVIDFYINNVKYQKYLRTFPYPDGEALLFLTANQEIGLKEIIISQFRSDKHLIFTLRYDVEFNQTLIDLITGLLKKHDMTLITPHFDAHASGYAMKLTLPLEKKELIAAFLNELEILLQRNKVDQVNFNILQEIIRQKLGYSQTLLLNEQLSNVKLESDIQDIVVADLTNLSEINNKIEQERSKARNSNSLTLRIIQDNVMKKANKSQPEYIYLGMGYPTHEHSESVPVPIEQFEQLIQKIRGVANYTYSDAIAFVNNTILRFGEEELSLTGKAEFVSSEFPVFQSDFFEVRYINDEINFGIFARQDILKDTPLGVFSGLNGLPLASYGYSLIDLNPSLGEGLCEISPERSGNWSHFVNHAPCEPVTDEVHRDVISEKIRSKIELANIQEQWTEITGYLYPILVASKDISKGKEILFDYEPYWFNWLSRHGKLRYSIFEENKYKIVDNNGTETSTLKRDSQNALSVAKLMMQNMKPTEKKSPSLAATPFWQEDIKKVDSKMEDTTSENAKPYSLNS